MNELTIKFVVPFFMHDYEVGHGVVSAISGNNIYIGSKKYLVEHFEDIYSRENPKEVKYFLHLKAVENE